MGGLADLKQKVNKLFWKNKPPLRSRLDTVTQNIWNFSPLENINLDVLSLNDKFIPHPKPINTDELYNSLHSFHRSLQLNHLFNGRNNTDYDPRLHIKSSWFPPITTNEQKDIQNNFLMMKDCMISDFTHINYPPPSTLDSNILYKIKTLKRMDNIKIVKSDKNLGLVALTIQQYDEKIIQHLSTTTIYNPITSNYNHYLDTLKFDFDYVKDFLTTKEKSFCLNQVDFGLPATFHGLPKLHKTTIWSNIKFRPIVANRPNMIQHRISVICTNRLEHLQDHFSSILKNSLQLVNTLNRSKFSRPIKMMLTFDFESLYTNINTRDLLTVFSSYKPTQKTVPLIKLICSHNYFGYNNTIYHQTDGIAMGTSVAPILANIYLALIVDEQIKALPNVILYKRYIDDVFILLSDTDTENTILQIKDIISPFKAEFNFSAKHVDFLDLSIHIINNNLEIDLYQKPINKYLYLPANSHHPIHQITGFIRGELLRYRRICSNDQRFKVHKLEFYNRLKKRGYSRKFLDKLFLQPLTPRTRTHHSKPIINFIIRYHPCASFIKILKKHLKNLNLKYPNQVFRLVFKNSPNLQKLLIKSALSDRQQALLRHTTALQQPLPNVLQIN
jgi:hypothetical protein